MTIDLIVVGKSDLEQVASLVDSYMKRINHYVKFSIITIPDPQSSKKTAVSVQKRIEGELLLKQLTDGDYVVVLDERGATHSSLEFAEWMQKRLNSGVKRVVFIIGGAFGFSDALYERANDKISLSKMTFSHQIIRIVFAEQLYRSFTILNNEPYHHE